MPRLESYFNYRHIDVSSFKEAAVRWMNEAQVYEKARDLIEQWAISRTL